MVWWAGLTHGSSDVTGWWLSCLRRVDRLGSLSKCSLAGRHVLIGVWRVPDSELTDARPGCAPDNTEGRSSYGERQSDRGLRWDRHARRYTSCRGDRCRWAEAGRCPGANHRSWLSGGVTVPGFVAHAGKRGYRVHRLLRGRSDRAVREGVMIRTCGWFSARWRECGA